MNNRIANVSIKNFGPYESAEYRLGDDGLTLIEGEFRGFAGFASNGSGKSMLIEAVVWCLFGRMIRADVGADDVLREGAVGGGYVDVTIEDNGQTSYRIRRHRKH